MFHVSKYGMTDDVDEVIYRFCGREKGGCGEDGNRKKQTSDVKQRMECFVFCRS
jgi:hypothetical protein